MTILGDHLGERFQRKKARERIMCPDREEPRRGSFRRRHDIVPVRHLTTDSGDFVRERTSHERAETRPHTYSPFPPWNQSQNVLIPRRFQRGSLARSRNLTDLTDPIDGFRGDLYLVNRDSWGTRRACTHERGGICSLTCDSDKRSSVIEKRYLGLCEIVEQTDEKSRFFTGVPFRFSGRNNPLKKKTGTCVLVRACARELVLSKLLKTLRHVWETKVSCFW